MDRIITGGTSDIPFLQQAKVNAQLQLRNELGETIALERSTLTPCIVQMNRLLAMFNEL